MSLPVMRNGHVNSGSSITSLRHLKYGLNRIDILLTALHKTKFKYQS
jgi:hypothetical protein